MSEFDAVVVPGGGLRPQGELPPWFINRLDAALDLANGAPILTLSAGTTHKPPPLDRNGRPMLEAFVAAQYLLDRGYSHDRLLVEAASYDTIGNAYFARTVHTDPAGLRKLLVITSEFHMPRTAAIFRWIFGASPLTPDYELSFHAVPDVGLPPDALTARRNKELASLASLQPTIRAHPTLVSIHQWLFREHDAYAAGRQSQSIPASGAVLDSY